MATTVEYIEMVVDRIRNVGEVRYQKMFGEYLIYVDEKPILLVCDNTVYIKILPCIEAIMANAPIAAPYEGAKPHYLLDIDDKELSVRVIATLLPNVQIKKKKVPVGRTVRATTAITADK